MSPRRHGSASPARGDSYELREVMLRGDDAAPTRREFLKVMGAGLVVVLVTRDAFAMPLARRAHQGTQPVALSEQIGAWLHIAGDGAVTVYTGKVEFGQGIRTSLAQELAEELRVPLARVQLVMGDTDLTPYDMGTFGSRSTPQMGTQLRKVGAAARDVLIGLAAAKWGVDRSALDAADGNVVDTHRRRSIGYGALTAGRRLTETVRDDVPLTPAAQWRVAGAPVPRVGARDIVTGRHQYASDVRVPGLLYGKILRAPAIGVTLASVDTRAAAAMPNVIVAHDGDVVGVAAPATADAERALAAIRASWSPAPDSPSSRDVYDYLVKTRPRRARGMREGPPGADEPFTMGDVDAALASAEHTLTRRYTTAYIAHTPLEPRAAVAQWTREGGRDKVTVWTGTQRPFAVREEVASALGLEMEQVRVIVPDTGAGYGGKHTGEVAVEATRLARAAGRPVKVVWTREEEFRWAYFRPAAVIDITAAVKSDGTITAWTCDNYNAGPAAIRPYYAIANQRIAFHPSESPLRQGSYRALAATANQFARETHIDELAHLVAIDPLAFRVANTSDPRMRAVFQAAADRFGWGRRAASGHGHGIAGGFEKGGYVATCAEVAVGPGGAVRIVRAVTAFDCGAIVNPDGLRNQITGAMIQAIGGALFEEIDFDHGVIRNPRLSQYRVPRFGDVPVIDVVLVDRKDAPSMGAGEAPIMALAPAVGSAIFDATGVRPRSLPMARGGLRVASG